VKFEVQLKNSVVTNYYTYESGTYPFETQKGYLGSDLNYIRVQLKKALPCSSSTCSFKIKNLTVTLPPLEIPCPPQVPEKPERPPVPPLNGQCKTYA
jgi:hypothetical protein